jgi:hypothetical protein
VDELYLFKPSLSRLSARERWILRSVSFVLGLLWGALGLFIGTSFLIAEKISNQPDPHTVVGVLLGMMLGVGQASQWWLARSHKKVRGVWQVLELLECALVCIVLGICWGTIAMFIYGVVGFGLTPLLVFIPLLGVITSVRSVVPAALVMAPVTLFVWHRTLERLKSQHISSKDS